MLFPPDIAQQHKSKRYTFHKFDTVALFFQSDYPCSGKDQ